MTTLSARISEFVGAIDPIHRVTSRLALSRAKHPSLRGHGRMSQHVSKLVRFFEHGEDEFFGTDGAPGDVVALRRAGFERLRKYFLEHSPTTLALTAELEQGLSDLEFVNAYRVPFQYRNYVRQNLRIGSLLEASDGARVRDLDGNWSYDVSGSYGVNLFGYDFYKRCIDRGAERARALGPVLGSYHPIIVDNVHRLKAISGMDEVSFHMSGTEAVMQAARLARYHTRRSHVVRFCGAYHGWWDGVQPGPGNPRPPHEVYTLEEMSDDTLEVLRTRNDIACVLVNPIQAMHPNGNAPSDSTLVASDRTARFDRAAYSRWLRELREVCDARKIAFIMDEVFMGFRLARGGAQEYFGVQADLVTYGKTLGGGLPIGVVCGTHAWMKRYSDEMPADICFARGTFNSHPYVMTTMNEFLRHLDEPEVRAEYARVDAVWDARAHALDERLQRLGLPVRIAHMTSVWTTLYETASRYNWMFQYYLRAAGLTMSWIGTGRFIFSHALTNDDFTQIADRYVSAARAMKADGWWWEDPALSNKSIQRRILRDMITHAFARVSSDREAVP